jgi:hypothetical protein
MKSPDNINDPAFSADLPAILGYRADPGVRATGDYDKACTRATRGLNRRAADRVRPISEGEFSSGIVHSNVNSRIPQKERSSLSDLHGKGLLELAVSGFVEN